MSRTNVNRSVKTVVGVPFSTSESATSNTEPPYRILVPAQEINKDVTFNGEIKTSMAKVDQMRVLDKSRLETRIGRLTTTAIASVGLGISYLFDLR